MSRSLKYRYLDSRFSEAWDANGDGAGAGGMRSSEGTGEGGDENESNGWITSMLARRASEAMPNIIGAGMLGSFKSNDESGDSSAFSSESESEEDSVAPPPPPPPTVGEEESASPRMKRSSSIDRAKRPSPLLDVSLDGADPMPFINSPSELTPKPFVGDEGDDDDDGDDPSFRTARKEGRSNSWESVDHDSLSSSDSEDDEHYEHQQPAEKVRSGSPLNRKKPPRLTAISLEGADPMPSASSPTDRRRSQSPRVSLKRKEGERNYRAELGAAKLERACASALRRQLCRGFDAIKRAAYFSWAQDEIANAKFEFKVETEMWKKERQRLKERTQYTREALEGRLRRTALRFGRDKLLMVLAKRKTSGIRVAFERWRTKSAAHHERARLLRRRHRLDEEYDRIRFAEERAADAQKELARERASSTCSWMFSAWRHRAMQSKQRQLLRQIQVERDNTIERIGELFAALQRTAHEEDALYAAAAARGEQIKRSLGNLN